MNLNLRYCDTAPLHASLLDLTAGLKTLRFLAIMPAALATTLILIWGMNQLISMSDLSPLVEPPTYKVPDPVMPDVEPPQVEYRKPTPPEKVEPEPVIPGVDLNLVPDDGPYIPITPPETSAKPPRIGNYSADMPVPTMLVQPAYPVNAANRGIEGYVDVQFDVAATGATENIVILASVPPNVFDRETVKAVKRWKFNPVVRDGRTVPYKGLVQRVNFEMQKP